MKVNDPRITEKSALRVLTITSIGDPNKSELVMKALYGTAYATKMKVFKPQGKTMTLGKLIGRWPDAHLKPKDQWMGIWAIPVPNFVTQQSLIQKDPQLPIAVETWDYGMVAEILHAGSYSNEGPTIEKLHEFIRAQGYEPIEGSHEEEYLTSPDAKNIRTIIRHKINKL